MRQVSARFLVLVVLVALAALTACGANPALPQTFRTTDSAARLRTTVSAPAGWVAQMTPETITLASSDEALAKLQQPNASFAAGDGLVIINRLPTEDVAGLASPVDVYQALRRGSTIAGATILGEGQGVFGGKPVVKAQIESLNGSGYVYVVRAGAHYFLVLTVAQTAIAIEATGDAVVSSLDIEPGDGAVFSLTISEPNLSYSQDPGFVVLTENGLHFLNLGDGASLIARVSDGITFAVGDYPLVGDERFATVTIPAGEGRVLACAGVDAGTLTISDTANGLLSGSLTLTANDCVLRAFPSQEALNDAPQYAALTISGTFENVPMG